MKTFYKIVKKTVKITLYVVLTIISLFLIFVFFAYHPDMFKETVYIDVIDAYDENVASVYFDNIHTYRLHEGDDRNQDIKKINECIKLLEDVPMVHSDKSEFPNITPDAGVYLYDKNDNKLCEISIYGEVFVEYSIGDDVSFYKVKNEKTMLIKEMEIIVYDESAISIWEGSTDGKILIFMIGICAIGGWVCLIISFFRKGKTGDGSPVLKQ